MALLSATFIVSFVTDNPEPDTTRQTPPAAPAEQSADDGVAVTPVEGAEPLERAEESEGHPTLQSEHWWHRRTLRALKREVQERDESLDQWDERGNAATRLPAEESVHLGGFVLAEAFTPSTVSALYDTLRRSSGRNNQRGDEWIAQLDRSRSGHSGGFTYLGVVRRPGENIFSIFDGDGSEDSELPNSVIAVWLLLAYLMPSVAVVVATFTFSDDAADVSSLLRRDYHTQFTNPRIRVYGKFGRLRAWLPWSRPKYHGMTYDMSRAEDEKRLAFERIIQEREGECSRWFTSRFRGRFALADSAARPVARLIFTEKAVPFKDRSDWLRPIGLHWSPTFYRSTEIPDWAFREGQWPYAKGRFVLTFAARRRDAARERTKGESGEQNWDLTQRFNREQAPLVALYAIRALLSLYGERLAKLRDGARARHRPRRPVRDALALDDYLTTDGLDAATITADVGVLTSDLRSFRWGVPEYTEDEEGLPDTARSATPLELVPALCSSMKEQAARLAADTQNTVGNIRGSAELKQAIANTRLQRAVIVVSLAALIVAVVALLLPG
jgi:hypothetical protein